MMIEEGMAKKVMGMIGQGKEANVYWMKNHKNKLMAGKMFRIHTTNQNFRKLSGKTKLMDTGKLDVATSLCLREFENLQLMYDAGVRVPKPLNRKEFIYTMQFLGNARGPAPLLRDCNLAKLQLNPIDILDETLEQLDLIFNKAQMVHGDYSEHNIIMFNDQPWIIDVVQADRFHPKYATTAKIRKREAFEILKRDLGSILEYFKKVYRVTYDYKTVLSELSGNEIEDLMPDSAMSEEFRLDQYQQQLREKMYEQ